MKKFWTVVCLICFLLGTSGMIVAIVFQTVLVYKAYGTINLHDYSVPHWSMWFWVSLVLYIPCMIIFWKGGDE